MNPCFSLHSYQNILLRWVPFMLRLIGFLSSDISRRYVLCSVTKHGSVLPWFHYNSPIRLALWCVFLVNHSTFLQSIWNEWGFKKRFCGFLILNPLFWHCTIICTQGFQHYISNTHLGGHPWRGCWENKKSPAKHFCGELFEGHGGCFVQSVPNFTGTKPGQC